MKYLIQLSILLFVASSCKQEKATTQAPLTSKVALKHSDSGYRLMVDGAAFYIKGAGLEFGSIPELAKHGGNAFRTWRTDNGQRSGKEVLDEAQANGLKVMMGIEVARERHGFDYNDTAAVRRQLEDIRQQVMELKDHPALIIWGIGNELNLRATNPKVWDAVNEISKMIHSIDTNHLTTTSLAGISKELVDDIKQKAPDLDLLSVQMYADIVNLPAYVDSCGWDGAYLVTEWGATGHWEVPLTEWGAPVENNSTDKARYYKERFLSAIDSQREQCVGSFVFLWGQKQERTPTWYGVYLEDGSATASVDVMHYLWNGSWPENQSPAIDSVRLNAQKPGENIYLKTGNSYPAMAWVNDPDADSITYQWYIMKESTDLGDGGDHESVPDIMEGYISPAQQAEIEMKVPEEAGAYRLFMYAYDGHGNAAHANIPFFAQ
jgi:hypothetical protein